MCHVGRVDPAFILKDGVGAHLRSLQREQEGDKERDGSAAILLRRDHEPTGEKQGIGKEGEVALKRTEKAHEEHGEACALEGVCARRSGILQKAGGGKTKRKQKQREADADYGKTNTTCRDHAEKCIAGGPEYAEVTG